MKHLISVRVVSALFLFLLICAPGWADLETFDADLGAYASWDSVTTNAPTATWNGTAGISGGGMVLSNSSGASEAGVKQYAIQANTLYMISASIQVQSGGGSPFWFEMGVKAGNNDATNFDTAAGTWFIPGKWEFGAGTGDTTKWSENDNAWQTIGMTLFSGPSDSILCVGFKLGGSGAPDVYIDDVHVTIASEAVTVDFDDSPYEVFSATTDGYDIGWGGTGKDCAGVLPKSNDIYFLACPSWMGPGINNGGGTSVRETSQVYSGAAWRVDNVGIWGDSSFVVGPLATTPSEVYAANFWMVRAATGADAWTNVQDNYNSHVAWRLANDPEPGLIEGWPGNIQADAFHVICEGASNTERNYAPDIYAPGSGTSINAQDATGSRYSSMVFVAADATTWFESCIRMCKDLSGNAGDGYWIVDDLRLCTHGDENLLGTAVEDWMLY